MADKIKLVLAALLLAAGVAGFYYLSDSAAIVRLAAIAAGAIAGIVFAFVVVMAVFLWVSDKTLEYL